MKNARQWKSFARIVLVLSILLSLVLQMNAIASESIQSGVKAKIETDKGKYAPNEEIAVRLTVSNNNSKSLQNVDLLVNTPAGYVLKQGTINHSNVGVLDSNESTNIIAVFVPASLPPTGDDTNLPLWISLSVASLVCIYLCTKHKMTMKMTALLLCIFISATSINAISIAKADSYVNWPEKSGRLLATPNTNSAIPKGSRLFASAASNSNNTETISVSEVVKVSDADLVINGIVSFTSPEGGDNLDDDIIDLGDIEVLRERGVVEVIHGDNGEIQTIDGTFTNVKVESINDAVKVLNSASSLFGNSFEASSSQVSSQSYTLDSAAGKEVFYRYTPNVGSIPVLGSQIVLITDKDGVVTGLTSTYTDRIKNIDTNPEITKERAENIAFDAFIETDAVATIIQALLKQHPESTESEIITQLRASLQFDSKLVIYAADNRLPVATVYSVRISSNSDTGNVMDSVDDAKKMPYIDITCFIYANGSDAGSIHSSMDNVNGWSNVTLTCTDLLNKERTFGAQKDGDKYRLKDGNRNIETYRTQYGGVLWVNPILPGKLVESFNILWGSQRFEKVDVSAHANITEVYDFYLNKLGWKSFDGNGAKIMLSTQYDNINLLFTGDYENAYWSSSLQQFVFGDGGNFAAALDVCGHEFTHAVINNVVGDGRTTTLTYYGESGALNESYADIMGCLIENKSGKNRWLLAEDSDAAIRNMAQPSQFGDPEHYNNRYTGTGDNAGVHTNSNIFNFAAYKMMVDSRTSSISTAKWAELFFRSLYRLESDATFLNARGAVINTSKRLGFNHDQQQAIKDAFDAVGIVESNSVRFVLTWGANPADLDSHLVGPGVNGGERFHVYYSQRSYDVNGRYDTSDSLYAADLDYDDTTSYGPEITTIHVFTPGTYYFYVHDYTNKGNPNSALMATSNATVKVYKGTSTTPSAQYVIDSNSSGTIWNVCQVDIDGAGKVTIKGINTYASDVVYN